MWLLLPRMMSGLIQQLIIHQMEERDQVWQPLCPPGLLRQLQGSECFLHSCSQGSLILQHLTQDRNWQLQQHTWSTHKGRLGNLLFILNLKSYKHSLFRIRKTEKENNVTKYKANTKPVSFPVFSLCFGKITLYSCSPSVSKSSSIFDTH